MEWSFFLLILPLILASFLLLLKYPKFSKTKEPPGPPGLPFIGNLHQFNSAKPHEYLWKLSKKYGPLMQLKLGSRPTVVITSAKIAKEVLKTQDIVFSSRPPFAGQQKLSYNGLDLAFGPYTEYLREMRKICVVNLFSLKRVQSFRQHRKDEISCLIGEISNLSSSSRVINLSSMLKDLTNRFICRVAFGKKFDKTSHRRKKFDKLLEECGILFTRLFVSDYFPLLGWIDKLSGITTRLDNSFRKMDEFYQELIDEHQDPNRPETMKDDLLDILIRLKEEESPSFHFSWDHIKAIVMNILAAGTNTSAATIVWTMMALMKKPSTMKRAQTEIRNFIDQKGVVDEDDVQEFIYLKAVVKEALRLYPPAPLLIPRESRENCTLEGFESKAKTLVYVNSWAIARDPENWENPEEFVPERFLNSSIDVKGNDFEVLPFGAGRRGCPGISMALATVELALANLLYYFDWEMPAGVNAEDIDTDVSPGITMHKKNHLCLLPRDTNKKMPLTWGFS